MCVKQAPGNVISDTHFDSTLFHRLTSAFPHLESLVLNGIGEPLLHPQLIDMISEARKHMPATGWIGFQTNGLLLDDDNIRRLLAAGLNRLCISVDSSGGEQRCSTALIHPPQHQRSPVGLVREICDRQGYIDVQLGAEIVLTRENLPLLPDLVSQLAAEGVDFIIGSHLLAYQSQTESHGIFNSFTMESWEIYRKWQSIAAAEDLNLADLTAKTWIAPHQESEHRLQKLYRQMLTEASERDIWLNIKKLALMDPEELSVCQDFIAKAETIAERLGVQISLPPLVASTARSCRFMEDQAVFVDVDGCVTPCHLLWHTQTIYMDSEAKHLQSKIFGSIKTKDILAIWNSTEYREFRQAALNYDYPFCHSCSLGPCPDITGETTPFVHDCFGTTVPCGHCFWCYDGIRCL